MSIRQFITYLICTLAISAALTAVARYTTPDMPSGGYAVEV